MNRLLILACSQRKTAAKGILTAIERYDGPAFRVLRKYLREKPSNAPSVVILSAKFGLIEDTQKIPNYDCRLSQTTAERLRPQVLKVLRQKLESQPWHSIGICAGQEYQKALLGFSSLIPDGATVDLIEGGLGPRLTRLRAWLHESRGKVELC
jgi:hypothetical protein